MRDVRLPSEKILRYIEGNRGVEISRNGFVSREYYNPHHFEGKNTPVFHANNGQGDGTQTALVEVNGIVYVVCRTGMAHSDPIEILRSGRKNER